MIAGFLTGVGLLIIQSQVPMLLAVGSWGEIAGGGFGWAALPRLLFGLMLIAGLLIVERRAPKIPALLAGLIGGSAAFHGLRRRGGAHARGGGRPRVNSSVSRLR